MKTIYKFPLEITGAQVLALPEDAEILSVVEQNNQVMLYVLADFSQPNISQRFIMIYGTGNPMVDTIAEETIFLGTVKTANGTLMWHVFIERKEGK